MQRTFFALFVALLIHIVIYFTIYFLLKDTPQIDKEQKKESRVKVYLKKPKKIAKDKSGITKKSVKKHKHIVPPMPKGKQLKKITKKVEKKQINKIKKKVVTKKPKISQKNSKVVKKVIEKKITQKKIDKKPDPMSWIYQDVSNVKQQKVDKQKLNGIDQDIKELYGDKFAKLTKGQQQYILDNQEIMRRITQEVLNRVASVNIPRGMSVNRTNIVEFYLYPNGDISDFKFLKKSGFFILDQTTKETIEYAYSKYPHPKEKTLIRYSIYYNLAQ